ncbi:hypothetical protein [Sphingomonas morindae]|uniref:Uncharacterized protein n=1 Tax=Sphingomonas morindae TaxID=1541170 RepID=A0ABY4XBT6_9SPHN|nr:hypothetical protein [Sphingomonas morindae]USI74313.1 hypothetical protein LHA26_07655 [Sphingomonas morindae]
MAPSPAPPPPVADATALITAGLRCRREAREAGQPHQPRLFGLLAPIGCEMLTPLLDSLFDLAEAWLGRTLDERRRPGRWDDAALLLTLLADPARLSAAAGAGPLRVALRLAAPPLGIGATRH